MVKLTKLISRRDYKYRFLRAVLMELIDRGAS